MDLDGRVVAVTGAARGIGRALAEAAQARGAIVVALDRDGAGAEAVAARLGGRAYAMDVADAVAVAEILVRIEAEIGPIALYCSNAGILERDPDPGLATSADPASWERAWSVNVMGHVHAARVLVPLWLARGEGAFLGTVSAAGLLSQIGSATYSATKHAALAFLEHLAIAHGGDGIRIAALCPQGVDTAMLGAASAAARDGVLAPEAVAEAAFDGLAAGRFLILPHPQVADYARRRADDPERWLAGMARLRRSTLDAG
ncbi:3-phenylpropionate-dihydrodiol/cinnamic acid-dihydrodiol dehydrogenase [Methylobacterium mesophilicum]|uniref:SDR family NAD(P)-dependent oxidoreductase n=1 Tax=Methylobacterium mesophilicum TaxID=39956 RepID=UPI001EE37EF5|nr:SDR family oxidoreductase [Methylobacterium mesophilicum]GJE20101.1 3-phenylpropionate-dihydrodiol/cinnamic acid-dihydrodiol dehydrogenase [Methylobacterium mesophilicum]